MKPVREIVSRDVIEDLWGAGYTILPRNRHPDPFYVSPEMIPATRSYQWWHLVHDKVHFLSRGDHSLGWAAVPASRHDGYFMPAGHVGDIEVNGLGLFEKPKFEVDAERAQHHAAAQKNVTDWIEKTGGEFFGGAIVGGVKTTIGDPIKAKRFFPETKAIDTTVGIPKDMLPLMARVFAERDRLYNELIEACNSGEKLTEAQSAVCKTYGDAFAEDPSILKGPSLNALLLPIAVDNVRKERKS